MSAQARTDGQWICALTHCGITTRGCRNTQYIKCDLLIIDDWLLEQVKPNEAREIMEVIEARDRTGSLILCSQFPPSAWHANLGNGAIADAVIDRVVYKSYTIHIAGEESMRKRMRGME